MSYSLSSIKKLRTGASFSFRCPIFILRYGNTKEPSLTKHHDIVGKRNLYFERADTLIKNYFLMK